MFDSLSIIILFVFFTLGIILYPKKTMTMNAVRMLPIAIVSTFCVQIVGAYVQQILNIKINILSANLWLLIANAMIWLCIIKKRRVQKLVWSLKDVAVMLLPLVLVIVEAYHMFSGELSLSYLNDDARTFFDMALEIVRTKQMSSESFNAYINALIIEMLSPWLSVVEYYKAFIIGDILMHMLEVAVMYAVMVSICRQKVTECLTPVLCTLYFLGYPTFSFMRGNFIYWSTGGVLFLYLVYAIKGIGKQREFRKYYFILLILGTFGSVTCNKLYALLNPVCVFIPLLIFFAETEKRKKSKRAICALAAICAMCVLALLFMYDKIAELLGYISLILSREGYTYKALYIDFIFFVPAIIIVIFYTYVRKQYPHLLCDVAVLVIACTVGMYVMYHKGWVSAYYYYKIYYCLWIVGWLMVVLMIDILADNQSLLCGGAYAIGLLCFVFFQFWNEVDIESESSRWRLCDSESKNYYNLYQNNLQYFALDYESSELEDAGRYISPELLNSYQYIYENYVGESIYFLSDAGNYMQGRWFSTIMNQISEIYYENFTGVVKYYLGAENTYIVLGKQSTIYAQTHDLYNDENIVYEDERLVMLKSAGKQ